MTTVFKKSLALIIAVVLCATAFIGCLTVNAEEVPTISVVDVTTVPGGLANVRINLENISTICGIDLTATFEEGVILNSVNGVSVEDIVEQYDEEGGNVHIVEIGGKPAVKFVDIINYVYNEINISNSTLTMDINVTAPETPKDYNVTLNVEAADKDANLIGGIVTNNGKITVAEATSSTYTLTNSVAKISGAVSSQNLYVGFNWEFNGGTPDKYGVKVYTSEANRVAGIYVANSELNKSTTFATVTGISCNAVNTSYIFVPYVVKGGETIEGSVLTASYADYLNNRIENPDVATATKEKANAIMNFSKLVSGDSSVTLTEYDNTATYTAETTPTVNTEDSGYFTAQPIVTGNITTNNSSFNLYVKFDYSDFEGQIATKGTLIYRAANFSNIPADVENSGAYNVVYTSDSKAAIVKGFNFKTISEKLVFVPYVIDNEGETHFGHAAYISYADYLGSKLATNGEASKINTAKKALTVMDLYETLNGTALYSKD